MKVFLTSLLRFTKGRASDKSILRQSQPLQHVLSNPNSAILVITLAMIVVHASIGVNQPLYMASFFFLFYCSGTKTIHSYSQPGQNGKIPPSVPLNAPQA